MSVVSRDSADGSGGAEKRAFVNNGAIATTPGGISANRIRLQLKLVDKMIGEKEKELQRMEWEEKTTPAQDVTPVFKARMHMTFAELNRLRDARKYWENLFNRELVRLKNGGAADSNLPHAPQQAEPLGPVSAQDLGLTVPEAPLPDSGPGGKVCGPNASKFDIDSEWDHYWREVARAQTDFRLDYSHWLVEKFAFDERRRKTLLRRRPFTEKEPPRPVIRVVPEPQCPKPTPASGTPL